MRRCRNLTGRRLIDRFEERAEECQSHAELAALVDEATRSLGFQFFALLHHSSLTEPTAGLIRLDTYPREWEAELQRDDLIGADPVHHACSRINVGFLWEELSRLVPLHMRDRDMLNRARRHGIADGFTVPIHIPGEPPASCTFAVRAGVAIPRDRLLSAEQLGIHAFHIARRLSGFLAEGHAPRLSLRARQCVRLMTLGNTDNQIAYRLAISPETVHQYIKQAKATYGVATRAQLAACALHDALVSFEDAIPRNRGIG